MKIFQFSSLIFFALLGLTLTTTEAYGQNRVLKELAKEDQDSRTGTKVERTDEDRIKIVFSILGEGTQLTPEDKFNAALVLQHTPGAFCEKRLVSKSPDNYLLAYHLFKSASEAGYKDARILVASALDRYLSFTEGYQKYGTNRVIDQETGREELVPVDRKTTDEERAKYGVLPLAELLKRYPEQVKKTP